MSTKTFTEMLKAAKPFFAVIVLQFGYAGMSIVFKYALNKGISLHVLVVYRHAVAAVVVAPFALVLERFLLFLSLNWTFTIFTL